MSLVTKKPSPVVIFLDKGYLSLYSAQLAEVTQLPFADGWVKDLEMSNLNDFSSQFSLFLTKLSLPPSEALLVLSKSIYFTQEIIDTKPATPTSTDQQVSRGEVPPASATLAEPNSVKLTTVNIDTTKRQQFVRSVPFSSVFSAVIIVNKHKTIIALNRDLYDPVLKILDSHHLSVVNIFPDSAIPNLTDQPLTPEMGKFIIANHQKWLDANLLHTQEEGNPGKIQVMPAKNDPERKRVLVLGVGFAVLILIFIGFLIYTLQKNAAEKAALQAKRAEIQAANASASASLMLSLTPSPSPQPASASAQGTTASQSASLRVIILNGTGVSGRAAAVQKALQQESFSQVTTGNTSTVTGGTTLIIVKPSVSTEIRQELVETLANLAYTTTITESSEITDDVRITLAQPTINDNL